MKPYAFKTNRERASSAASAFGGIAAFAVGIGLVFNPVVVTAAGVWSFVKARRLQKSLSKNSIESMVTSGYIEAVPADAPINTIVRDVSDALGRAETPQVYTLVERGLVGQVTGPQAKARKEAMSKLFAALPGTNALLTTKDALNAGYPENEMRFIAAHEVSHLQTDKNSAVTFGKLFVNGVKRPLLFASLGAAFLGIAAPLTMGVAALPALAVLVGAGFVANLIHKVGERIAEKRADRNALYITRDLEAAGNVMRRLYAPGDREKPGVASKLTDILSSHPGYTSRVKALRSAFNDVSRYPALPPTHGDGRPNLHKGPQP